MSISNIRRKTGDLEVISLNILAYNLTYYLIKANSKTNCLIFQYCVISKALRETKIPELKS